MCAPHPGHQDNPVNPESPWACQCIACILQTLSSSTLLTGCQQPGRFGAVMSWTSQCRKFSFILSASSALTMTVLETQRSKQSLRALSAQRSLQWPEAVQVSAACSSLFLVTACIYYMLKTSCRQKQLAPTLLSRATWPQQRCSTAASEMLQRCNQGMHTVWAPAWVTLRSFMQGAWGGELLRPGRTPWPEAVWGALDNVCCWGLPH